MFKGPAVIYRKFISLNVGAFGILPLPCSNVNIHGFNQQLAAQFILIPVLCIFYYFVR